MNGIFRRGGPVAMGLTAALLAGCSTQPEYVPHTMDTAEALQFQEQAAYCRANSATLLANTVLEKPNAPQQDVTTYLGNVATGGRVQVDVVDGQPSIVTVKRTDGTDQKVLIVAAPNLQYNPSKQQIIDALRGDSHVTGGLGFHMGDNPSVLNTAQGMTVEDALGGMC